MMESLRLSCRCYFISTMMLDISTLKYLEDSYLNSSTENRQSISKVKDLLKHAMNFRSARSF